ncbi:MAG: hypothetical protein FJ404_02785 [Verrucomicrobia bacterium]|nr:hypothetical protein [Verrucomicrobiota bacterium]
MTTSRSSPSPTKHRWKFFRAGGFDQVLLETGADLLSLDQLDQKLWVALACPTRGVEFDTQTLDLIDSDKDGRIRPPEILAAVRWAGSLLKNPDDLTKGRNSLPLAAIQDSSPEGKQVLAAAKQILANLGKADATEISAEDTADQARIFVQTRFNGDGIVTESSADDDATKAVIKDIIACLGAETDRSGKPGVSQAKIDQFFADAAALTSWTKKAQEPGFLPLADKSAEAHSALKAVRAKIDDFFARCRLAAFDSRALTAVNRQEAEYLSLGTKDLSSGGSEFAHFPLARVEAGKPLPLVEGVNPGWATALGAFHASVVKPILGDKASLTESEWRSLSDKFTAYEAWLGAKAGASVEKLGLARLEETLAGKAKETLAGLIAKDKALEPESNGIASVDRLVRYHRDMHRLLNNYVSFTYFYNRRDRAMFQAGTLYLDQRSCELCMRVEDPGKHASMAGLAGTYLAYCDCVRKGSGEKMQIVAAFTGGDSDNLMVGRNGVFYDRQGRDWDATISKIIDNPISIRQAFFAPYKKLVRMIEENIAKRAAAADSAATAKSVSEADKAKPAEPPKKIDTGTLAAIGLVLTTLLGALGTIFGKLLDLSWWQIPLAILAILVMISLPSVVMAYLKLRKRNLGPILDANGWAVNAKARINVPFGGSLTKVAAVPPGSEWSLDDPFAEQNNSSKWIVFAVILGLGIALASIVYKKGSEQQSAPEKPAAAAPAK